MTPRSTQLLRCIECGKEDPCILIMTRMEESPDWPDMTHCPMDGSEDDPRWHKIPIEELVI